MRPRFAWVQTLISLNGWRRNAAAFFLGITATLTLAPFFIFPFVIVAFSGLFLLVSGAPSHKRAFWDGWWWGWGFYITGLYWFCVALLTDAEKFAWLIPFALFGLTAIIALYCGVAGWIASRLRVRGASGVFLFSVVWVVVEFARGHLFSGFPWNLEGYSFVFSDISLQMASLVGAYGLTWFAVLLGAMPAIVCDASITKKHAWRAVVIVYGIFLCGMLWGAGRLHEADQLPQDQRFVDGIHLRLVQANISQFHKWNPQTQREGLDEYVRLTRSPGIEKVTHVIWPETSVPYIVKPGTPLVHMLGSIVPENGLLITGALRSEGEGKNWKIWNSIVTISNEGALAGYYDKAKLVPFGEFLPFRNLLPKFLTTPVGDTDFSSGHGPQTLDWGGISVSPLVCYEAIFPELAVAEGTRPQLLLNLTNDAWFGMSAGPYQHFSMARMRAVEQGIPLVRVANTGISAVTDSFGRVISSMALGTQGILDSALPKAQSVPTYYSRYSAYRENFLWMLVLTGLVLAGVKKLRNN